MERCSFGWNSRAFLERGRFDILNIHKPYDLPIAGWIKQRSGCKVVWRCHGPDYYPGLRHVLRYADAIYCVSGVAHENLLSFYPNVRAQIIYTGVDTQFFAPSNHKDGAPSRTPVVLYFGRMEGWKGVAHLVRAFKLLADVPFVGRIVGAGPDFSRVQELIQELGLGTRVTLEPALGKREAVRDLLANVDVVVFTAVAAETMSNAMLEAMAMGRAIVATRVGCFAEVLKHERTALLVEPRDPDSLAAAIRRLVQSPSQRAMLGDAARQLACGRFEAESSFIRVEKLFSNLCSPP